MVDKEIVFTINAVRRELLKDLTKFTRKERVYMEREDVAQKWGLLGDELLGRGAAEGTGELT